MESTTNKATWDKRLLLVAAGLGLLAMGLVAWRDVTREKELRGDQVVVLQWTHDLSAEQEVHENDIKLVHVPRDQTEALGGVVPEREKNIVIGARVNRLVRAKDWVRSSEINQMRMDQPSDRILPKYRAITLSVDPNLTPGDILRVDGHVDLIGMVSVQSRPPKAYVLLRNLRVLAVGGQSRVDELGGGRQEASARVYRSVTVEVPADVAVQIADLLPRVTGKMYLVVRNPTDIEDLDKNPNGSLKTIEINPEVRPVLDQPLPTREQPQ